MCGVFCSLQEELHHCVVKFLNTQKVVNEQTKNLFEHHLQCCCMH